MELIIRILLQRIQILLNLKYSAFKHECFAMLSLLSFITIFRSGRQVIRNNKGVQAQSKVKNHCSRPSYVEVTNSRAVIEEAETFSIAFEAKFDLTKSYAINSDKFNLNSVFL